MAAKRMDHTEYLSWVVSALYRLYAYGQMSDEALQSVRAMLWLEMIE